MAQILKITGDPASADERKGALLSRLIKRQITAEGGIGRRADAGWASLSLTQRKLWLLGLIDPSDASYNESIAFGLEHEVALASLRAAFAQLVERHEALRTAFAEIDGEPAQRIHPPFVPEIEIVEFGFMTDSEREAAAAAYAAEQEAVPFALGELPLFRAALLRFRGAADVLVLTFHHIHTDTWSVPILLRELFELYAAIEDGRPARLAPLRLQYGDFAEWQRRWYAGAEEARQLGYWREHLAEPLPTLDLLTDRPRPARPSRAGATVSFALDALATAHAGQLASRLGVTGFVLLLSGLYAALARLSGQRDLVVGCPVANRRLRETEDLIGFFANTLALRESVSMRESFAELVSRVRATVLNGFDHQDVPFDDLIEALEVERDPSRNPVFQVLFNYESAWASNKVLLERAGIAPIGLQKKTSKFDLSFYIGEAVGRIEGVIQYATELFDAATAQRMANLFTTMFSAAVASPDLPIGRLAILDEAGHRAVVETWNNTECRFETAATLHGEIERQCRATPDAPACRFDGKSLSYAELDQKAGLVAAALRREGAGPDSVVGVAARRSLDLLPILLGVMKAGAAYVPLDQALPAERIKAMIEDAAVALVVADEDAAPALAGLPIGVLTACRILDAQEPEAVAAVPTAPDNLAYVLFTSGSTGRPKASMIGHRAILNRLAWMQAAYGLTGDDRVLQKTPLSFDVSVWELFWPLTAGACLVLAEPDRQGDADYLWQLMGQEGITTSHFVPSMLTPFLEARPEGAATSLRRIVCSGEALSAAAVRSFERTLPGVALHNLYGPTEAAVDVTAWTCGPQDGEAPPPIGRPISNVQIYLLDLDRQPVPVGVRGALHIGGVALARGYAGKPGLTAERFVPHPFRSGERLYDTGDDAAYGPDGRIHYLGRRDGQVKLRGFRIELGEIEAALLASPEVRQAAVILVADGQGGKRLVAYVVPSAAEASEAPLAAALRQALERVLPGYMIPSAFEILERLPVTTSGKLDVRALPPPKGAETRVYVAPTTATERALERIWAAALRLDRVGMHDNYFELGGDSIRGIQLVTAARCEGVVFSVQQLFEHQTVATLAVAIDAAGPIDAPADGPAGEVDSAFGLTGLPHERIAALRQAHPDAVAILPVAPSPWDLIGQWASTGRPEINLVQTIGYSPNLNRTVLSRVFEMMVAANPVLRTSYAWDGLETPVQIVHAHGGVPVAYEDWRGLSNPERRMRAKQVLIDDGLRGAEPQRPSPWRVFFGQVGERDFITIQTFNYISLDGWSMLTIGREMQSLYLDIVQGRPAAAKVRPDYQVFLEWVRRHDWSGAEAFWRREMAGHQRARLAPAVSPAGPHNEDGYESRGAALPSELTQGVRGMLRGRQMTEGLFYLAAWSVLVSYFVKRRDLVLGIVITGRSPDVADIQDMIGYTMNYQPLRLHLDLADTPLTIVDKIKIKSIEIMKYEAVSLKQIKKWCGYNDDDLVFDSLFYFQNIGGYFTDGFSQTINQRRPLAYSRTAYPLRFDVFPTDAEIGNQTFAGYERSAYTAGDVDRLLQLFADTVALMHAQPTLPLVEMHARLAAVEARGEAERVLLRYDDLGDRLWMDPL